MKPISVQLYSLRDVTADTGIESVLDRLADIGYKGVEPAGFYEYTPEDFKKMVEDKGMAISSSHGPWAKPENLEEVVEASGKLGLDTAVAGFGPDQFKDMDAIKATADMVNTMTEYLLPKGIRLFMHNHYWEFAEVDGSIAYHTFAELAPDVDFEIDTYWSANFGACVPAEQVAHFASRAPFLHIKDGPLVKDEAMLAVGSGKMDIPSVIAAADESVLRWLVVELDKCDTDMFRAVEESYLYLVGEGLAEGNK